MQAISYIACLKEREKDSRFHIYKFIFRDRKMFGAKFFYVVEIEISDFCVFFERRVDYKDIFSPRADVSRIRAKGCKHRKQDLQTRPVKECARAVKLPATI